VPAVFPPYLRIESVCSTAIFNYLSILLKINTLFEPQKSDWDPNHLSFSLNQAITNQRTPTQAPVSFLSQHAAILPFFLSKFAKNLL
jgi:hypothetical protein